MMRNFILAHRLHEFELSCAVIDSSYRRNDKLRSSFCHADEGGIYLSKFIHYCPMILIIKIPNVQVSDTTGDAIKNKSLSQKIKRPLLQVLQHLQYS